MDRNEFREAQSLITKLEYADSILAYKQFYSLMVMPDDKSLEKDVYDPIEKNFMWEKRLQSYIRKGIVDYRVQLLSELRELGVDYE